MRPGQLDDEQVDSQIGSGFIEISRIELADEVRVLMFSPYSVAAYRAEGVAYRMVSSHPVHWSLVPPESVTNKCLARVSMDS